MVKCVNKAIQDIVDCIKNSPEYIECLEIKKKMAKNEDITKRISKIKLLQKKYIRTMSSEVEKELRILEDELNQIPIYVIYNQKLSIVNEKINYVSEEINDYFYKLFNEE